MAMPVTVRRFTVDEVLAWPDDGNRYELVDGVLLVTPAPMPPHQIVGFRLVRALTALLPRDPELHLATPGAILIRPGIKMEPDILVFRHPGIPRRWEEVRDHWLAVEVWSPSSVVYDRDIKRDALLQVGVREVWLVDPEGRTVFVSLRGEKPDVPYQDLLPWRPPGTDAPRTINLAEVFAGLE
ncbi:MAG: Uma2 family endonuclease [Gemmatimonadales bacterium]